MKAEMKRKNQYRTVLAVFITTLMIGSGFGGIALAGDVVDQQQTQHGATFFIDNYEGALTQFWAQSFKPSVSPLTKVDLRVIGGILNQEDLVLHIRHSSLGGDDLAVVHKTAEEIPYPGEWVTFDFPDIGVTIDDTYFIVLDKAPDTGDQGYCWSGTYDDLYSRGSIWYYGGSSWSEKPDKELSFITYTLGENNPPNTPINPSPSDGATGVSTSPTLSVDVSDPDGDSMDVTFYTGSGSLIGTDNDVASGSTASITWSGLSYDTTYYWYVIADDGEATTRGPTSGTWSFTTASDPTDPPSVTTNNADPNYGGATLNGYLDDMGGDSSCTVRFRWDTSSHSSWQDYPNETPYETKTSTGSFNYFQGLDPGTYYYIAVATNDAGTSQGSEKSFTVPEAPHWVLDPEILDFGNMLEGDTAVQTFEIWKTGVSCWDYEFSWGDWITDVTPQSGETCGEHNTITVIINTTGLSLDSHSTDIIIDSDGYPYPIYYEVTVNIVSSFPPPDVTLTETDYATECTDASIILFPIFSPFPIDWLLDQWPDDESEWLQDYGYYGLKHDTYTGYARSAMKARYEEWWLSILGLLWPAQIYMSGTQIIGVKYDVPISQGLGTKHNARISFKGDYEGEISVENFGTSEAILFIGVQEGDEGYYPYSEHLVYEQVQKYKVEVLLPYEVDDESFVETLNHDDNWIDNVRLEEGKSYIIWVGVESDLLLGQFEIPAGSLQGSGWSDIKYWFDEIKIDYHNPPSPPPPEGENFPETPTPYGPTMLIPNQEGTFNTNTIDLDSENQLYYKWYWGDGTTTAWLGPNASGEEMYVQHSYDSPGFYLVRVQAKDDSEYELHSNVSAPLQVAVGFDGSITINSPVGGEQWYVGTEHEITWSWTGDVAEELFIALYKEIELETYEFDHYITTNPVPTSDGTYLWNIGLNQEIGNYVVVIFNEANASSSNAFSILNHPPVLSNYPGWSEGVEPDFGTLDTEFAFRVHYFDQDGHEPAVKEVIIDDVHYDMIGSGSDSNYILTLLGSDVGGGTHDYYFYFEDALGDWDILPDAGGPGWQFAVNLPPNISSNPDPYDGETDVDVDHNLSWTGGDPDIEDTVTYDVYFGTTTTPPQVSSNQSDTTYDPGTMNHDTIYYWKIVAWDNHDAYTTGPIWSFTTEEEPEPDLDCDGSLSWTDVTPGDTVTGSFTIENIGDPGSLLDWEVIEWPDWGSGSSWTFTPTSGDDLTPENGPVSVDVSVIAPDVEEETFSGEIKVINRDDSSDFDIIPVSLITPHSQPQTCFLAGTQIAMADESYKNIENIKVGDTVKSYNITTREIVNTTVTKVHNHTPDKMTDHYLIINNNIKVTPNHIVFINGTLMRVKHAKVGDIIVGVNGEDTTIDSMEKVFKKVPTYNFEYMPMSNLYITEGMGAYSQKIKIKNPMKPIGKFRIDKGVKYSYSTFTIDIASDKLFYVFDWGDGTNSGWLGPINSGETVEASHIWNEKGKYNIKVNARDSYGELSEWSDPLAVAMVK